MSNHARLSPSNHRWPHCPGSVREEAAYPDTPGEAAIDGTGSHILLEMCILQNTRAEAWLGQTIGEGHEDRLQGWIVKEDRCKRVQMALDYITRRRTEINGKLTIDAESPSNPGVYFNRNDWYGTADITLISNNLIEVIDYKDGQMFVSAMDNSQFYSYAIGKFGMHLNMENIINVTESKIKQIRMSVIQPKTNPVVRYEEVTPVELWERAGKLAKAAALTDDSNAPLVVGKHCQWCAHGRTGNCSAKNEKAMKGIEAMDIATSQKTVQDMTAPKDMTDERLGEIFNAWSLIKKTFEEVEKEIMSRLEAGASVPNCAIGNGRSSKKFMDEEAVVEKKLKGMRFKKADIYPAKLITPAQALKREGLTDRQIKRLNEMIEEVPGKKKVVKAKPIIKATPQEMFKDVVNKTPATETKPAMSFM